MTSDHVTLYDVLMERLPCEKCGKHPQSSKRVVQGIDVLPKYCDDCLHMFLIEMYLEQRTYATGVNHWAQPDA